MEITIENHLILVDKEDWEKFKNIKWKIEKGKKNPYIIFKTSQKINGKKKTIVYRLHRMIMNVQDISWKDVIIDHINGNQFDNRKCNLRIANHNTNQYNTKKSVKNTTGYRGVDYKKSEKKYRARISHNGSRIELGGFITALEAAKAYNEAAIKYHGEFAVLNNIT